MVPPSEISSLTRSELVYGVEDRPPLIETLFAACQHVLAIFVGIVTPPLVVCNALKIGASETAFLVSMSLFVSGIGTWIQTRRFGPLGSGLLCIQGTGFTFIGPIIAAAVASLARGATPQQALGNVFGLCFVGSFVAILISRFLHYAGGIITPLVTGTVVLLVGLTLIGVGITSVGGGFSARHDGTFGSEQNLFLAALVMSIIVVFSLSKNASLRMASVAIGLAVGCITAFFFGRVNFGALGNLPFIAIPSPFRYGLGFDFGAFAPLVFIYLITIVESIGHLTAASTLTNQPIFGPLYLQRLKGGILADGVSCLVAACFNSFPSTIFAQNNGVVQLTGVGSRYVGIFIAAILVALGLIPMVGGAFQAMPPAVLGGATLVMFGSVAVAGVKILAREKMTRRSYLIMALSLGVGLGVTLVPEILSKLPPLVKSSLSSGAATGGMCALLLNWLLPEK